MKQLTKQERKRLKNELKVITVHGQKTVKGVNELASLLHNKQEAVEEFIKGDRECQDALVLALQRIEQLKEHNKKLEQLKSTKD